MSPAKCWSISLRRGRGASFDGGKLMTYTAARALADRLERRGWRVRLNYVGAKEEQQHVG
jgi:hypothetical protein